MDGVGVVEEGLSASEGEDNDGIHTQEDEQGVTYGVEMGPASGE